MPTNKNSRRPAPKHPPPEDDAPPLMRIARPDGVEILRVEQGGGVRIADGVDLDDVARKFWHAVAGQQSVLAEMREKLVLFLSGPMAGLPDSNRAAFSGYAAMLNTAGFQVVDPTTLEGFGPATPYEVNLRISVAALMRCTGVALLPGWQTAPAALREVEIATACGMTVAPVDYWLYRPTE